ncbi:Pycsar system effector family protein [Parasphingorhabdus sp. JC815]|uniref:Pycsar system effector family protein n=1 Tax=Parasphingorhabdus sp. JC815 TaxID=3232140 RepID=UPI00345A8128
MSERNWPDDVIHALRTTQQHHVQLSLMADHKANMLIGATFVVFTLAIGQSQSGDLSIPLLILAVSAFASAGLAAIAVMPATVPRGDTPSNLLFFGGFRGMTEDEYVSRLLDQELESQEATYRAMSRDIYQMGTILGRKKYRFLGWAYRVFLFGLTLTFASYMIELFAGPLV